MNLLSMLKKSQNFISHRGLMTRTVYAFNKWTCWHEKIRHPERKCTAIWELLGSCLTQAAASLCPMSIVFTYTITCNNTETVN
jgi:hypothetical protein